MKESYYRDKTALQREMHAGVHCVKINCWSPMLRAKISKLSIVLCKPIKRNDWSSSIIKSAAQRNKYKLMPYKKNCCIISKKKVKALTPLISCWSKRPAASTMKKKSRHGVIQQ